MTDWKITAKTIYCDAVDDEVTLILHREGPISCTGCQKYNQPSSITLEIIREKTKLLKRAPRCEGEQCPRVIQYKEKILAEEK